MYLVLATFAKINSNYLKMSDFSSRNVRYPRYQDTDLLQLCFFMQNIFGPTHFFGPTIFCGVKIKNFGSKKCWVKKDCLKDAYISITIYKDL